MERFLLCAILLVMNFGIGGCSSGGQAYSDASSSVTSSFSNGAQNSSSSELSVSSSSSLQSANSASGTQGLTGEAWPADTVLEDIDFTQMKPVKLYSAPFVAWGDCTGAYSSDLDVVYEEGLAGTSSVAVVSSNNANVSYSSSSTAKITTFSEESISLPLEDAEPAISAEATEFYFSYDESESTASRDLSLAAIWGDEYLDREWGRTFEFLNAEHFGHFNAVEMGPFEMSIGLHKSANGAIPVTQSYDSDLYTFGVNLTGPTLTKQARKNVVLTLLVDVSGSMNSNYGFSFNPASSPSSLLDVTQHAMYHALKSLKEGDVVNLVTFESTAEVVLSNWQYAPGDCGLVDAVAGLDTRGSTNLNEGISFAYQVARETYDPEKANRVIILTDAYANTGEVDPDVIARQTVIDGLEGIYFSGVGIGSNFNDYFLNELTDTGKGTYSAMVSPNDAERIMTEGFSRFIDYAVENVRFKLSYPQSLDQLESAAEEISTVASEVSKINFSYNSDQFFLESFKGIATNQDQVTFTIYYDDENGKPMEIAKTLSVGQIIGEGENTIRSALMVAKLAQVIGEELSCAEVMGSDLYLVPADSEIYDFYQKALTKFCSREPVIYHDVLE